MQYVPNPASFNGHTTYGDDFTAKPIPREAPVPMQPAPQSPPFDARTTNQDEYYAKPLPSREAPVPQQWQPSPGKFQATTEYGSNFQVSAPPPHALVTRSMCHCINHRPHMGHEAVSCRSSAGLEDACTQAWARH